MALAVLVVLVPMVVQAVLHLLLVKVMQVQHLVQLGVHLVVAVVLVQQDLTLQAQQAVPVVLV